VISITEVHIDDETEQRVLEVLRSGQLAQGPQVAELERLFASVHGVEHAIAVSSGTTALVAALQALGVGPGDEVVTSPFTFVATLNAILDCGATARFADIGDDYNVLPDAMGSCIGPSTRALLPVHLYGTMADMTPIVDLATSAGLAIVEDAAQAVGAEYQGRMAGSFGLGCFSLYATKNVSTGEGGMVTTNDSDLADRLQVLRNQGMQARYDYVMPGHNYRMTDLCAAVGISQVERLADISAARSANAAVLREGLGDLNGLVLPPEPEPGRTHVYHQFTVRITGEAPISRDGFADALREAGVGCGVYYPGVVFDYDCYRNHPGVVVAEVPNARAIASEVTSLPVHPHLTEADLEKIVVVVREVLGG
jgi:perosamine synthetase